MKNFSVVPTAMLVLLAQTKADNIRYSQRTESYAVFGDWPYSQILLDEADKLIDSINSDKSIKATMHVGDIHSGSMPCTGAGMEQVSTVTSQSGTNLVGKTAPLINPLWNTHVYHAFQKFNMPLIYTPGDNEWTDCHKSKEFSSGDPLAELTGVRELFFSKPGYSLGRNMMRVMSQSQVSGPDSQYVENVMWQDSMSVVFATFNIPGGANDDSVVNGQWSAPFTNDAAQNGERDARRVANLNWLDATFALANNRKARAVVLLTQADMWDTEKGLASLTDYKPFIDKLAALCLAFGKPVLLLNGDSHVYKADQPLKPSNGGAVTSGCDSTTACDLSLIHNTPAVPNFYRVVVYGSGEARAWLKLTIKPRAANPADVFSWENVQYST